MVNQTKSKKKLKHIHFSAIIFAKLVIPAGKKEIQSKTRIVKALVESGASESIIAKAKALSIFDWQFVCFSFSKNRLTSSWVD